MIEFVLIKLTQFEKTGLIGKLLISLRNLKKINSIFEKEVNRVFMILTFYFSIVEFAFL